MTEECDAENSMEKTVINDIVSLTEFQGLDDISKIGKLKASIIKEDNKVDLKKYETILKKQINKEKNAKKFNIILSKISGPLKRLSEAKSKAEYTTVIKNIKNTITNLKASNTIKRQILKIASSFKRLENQQDNNFKSYLFYNIDMTENKYNRHKEKIASIANKVVGSISSQAKKMEKYIKKIDSAKQNIVQTIKNIQTNHKASSNYNIRKFRKILQNLNQIRSILSDTLDQIHHSTGIITKAVNGIHPKKKSQGKNKILNKEERTDKKMKNKKFIQKEIKENNGENKENKNKSDVKYNGNNKIHKIRKIISKNKQENEYKKFNEERKIKILNDETKRSDLKNIENDQQTLIQLYEESDVKKNEDLIKTLIDNKEDNEPLIKLYSNKRKENRETEKKILKKEKNGENKNNNIRNDEILIKLYDKKKDDKDINEFDNQNLEKKTDGETLIKLY